MTDSSFINRLGYYLPLDAREKATLARLEAHERSYRKGMVIRREHEKRQEFCILQDGWLTSFILLNDGSRQIIRLHLPGELVGLSCAAYAIAPETLCAVTDTRLCLLDRAVLADIFSEHPRLATLLFGLAQVEQVAMGDRMAAIGRMSAQARLAGLILDTLARLRIANQSVRDNFCLPLTQEEIGDATGLTAVHVNRMFRVLVEARLIARNGNRITILDEPRLGAVANFIDRYSALDINWMPQSR